MRDSPSVRKPVRSSVRNAFVDLMPWLGFVIFKSFSRIFLICVSQFSLALRHAHQIHSFASSFTLHYVTFLDASSHLYKSVCPSVRPSVRRSIGNAFVKNARKSLISPILSLPFNALGRIIGRWAFLFG